MDTKNEDSNHDRLIEDYLFSGYKPASYIPAPDVDQQFARPIEDEDIFGASIDVNTKPAESQPAPKPESVQARERLRNQILARGLKPKKLGTDYDKHMIEVELEAQESPSRGRVIYEKLLQKSADSTIKGLGEPLSKGRMIYERMVQKSDECKNGLYGGRKLTWPVYRDALRKKICAEKRKIWDSFQKPADNFDDEEEMILSDGEPVESEPRSPAQEPEQNLSEDGEREGSEAEESEKEGSEPDNGDQEDSGSEDDDPEVSALSHHELEDKESRHPTKGQGKRPVIEDDDSDY